MSGWEYFENFTYLVLLVVFAGLTYISGRDWWNRWRKKRQVASIIYEEFSKHKWSRRLFSLKKKRKNKMISCRLLSAWMKQRSKICMVCEKPVRFWQRKYKLFPWDYCVWHWGCRPQKEVKDGQNKRSNK